MGTRSVGPRSEIMLVFILSALAAAAPVARTRPRSFELATLGNAVANGTVRQVLPTQPAWRHGWQVAMLLPDLSSTPCTSAAWQEGGIPAVDLQGLRLFVCAGHWQVVPLLSNVTVRSDESSNFSTFGAQSLRRHRRRASSVPRSGGGPLERGTARHARSGTEPPPQRHALTFLCLPPGPSFVSEPLSLSVSRSCSLVCSCALAHALPDCTHMWCCVQC